MAEELQRILECPMCLELYDSADRWPKLLPCQHTFCRMCLVQLDNQATIVCPQCRQQHKSPAGGAQQLPNNFTMLALLDVHQKSAPSTTPSVSSTSEAVPEKSITDSVRKAIAELARRLQQKAGELSSFDTKQKTIDEKFLAVKTQVDAAFESRARDLQIRKEAVIKHLAGMRQEELNMVATQKASAYQYLQKFQRDFATMRESILTSQQPTQEQYNQLLTVCQRYTQQIEHYALNIDEQLREISFTDPNRTQLAVSINSYGVLQANGMDKNKPTNASILQLQSPSPSSVSAVSAQTTSGTPTTSATPPAFTRKLSTPNMSVANLSQSLPHVASSPNIPQQGGSPSTSCASSRSDSPSLFQNRNRSQTFPNMNQVSEGQSNSTSSASSAPKDGTGSAFALVGGPSSSARSESSTAPQITGGQTGEASQSRNPFLSSDSTSSTRSTQSNMSQNSLGSTASQRKPTLPCPTPSSNFPVSRSPAAGDAATALAKHVSLDKPIPPRVKPGLPTRPSNYTRHTSIDFSGNTSPASGNSNSPLARIREQSSTRSRPASINFDTSSSSQTGAMVSPEGFVPPLPPRRVKTSETNRSRSMSTDTGLNTGKTDWAKFDTIGSRSRRFGKDCTKEVAVVGSGWFGGSFFERPTGVVVLPNNLMAVVDDRNHCISIVTDAGQLFKTLGSQGNGQGQLQFPKGICLNSRCQIIVSDWWNHRIQIWDVNGQFVSQFGSRGSGATQLNGPMGVACDASDNIFICDTNNHCVKVFSPEGRYLRQIGKEGSSDGNFICPSHLVVSPGGELLITDSGKHCVQMFSTQGTFLYQFGEWGTGPGQLNCPSGIMIDSSGYLFVSSSGNHRVEVYNPSGSYAASIGTHGSEKGQFDEPIGITSTSDGQIVVCDSGNKRLQIMLCFQENQSFV